MNADSVSPDGLNQSRRTASPVVRASPDFANAMTANSTSTTIWKPTRTNCTFSVVVMPR